MSVAELNGVELENIGPIEGQFTIELAGPGLYELRGSKGRGKSTILNALSMISGHKVSLTVHDGELAGKVAGFGVVVPVGGRKRPKGECSVDVLDTEKFDLIDLIDPDGKTPETRDTTRIKALASLCGVKLEAKDFYDLVGTQEAFEEFDVTETDDPVLFATRVKTALDKAAKAREGFADTQVGHAKALQEQVAEVDLTAESDADVLAERVDQATSKLSRMLEAAEQGKQAAGNIATAKEQLAKAKESYQGPSVEQAEVSRDVAKRVLDNALELKLRLEEQLAEAKEKLAVAQGAYNSTVQEVHRAEQHAADIAQWEESIAGEVSMPSEAEIQAAQIAKDEARKAQEEGVRIRDAKEAQVKAAEHKDAARRATAEAKELRACAGQVFDVLMKKLNTKVIRIESVAGSPRLVVDHPERGKALFDQHDGLSDGERVRAAIDELLPHLASPGLFPVPQRTYQDLPPADRKELAEYAAAKGLYVFGAQVTDGDLTVEKIG